MFKGDSHIFHFSHTVANLGDAFLHGLCSIGCGGLNLLDQIDNINNRGIGAFSQLLHFICHYAEAPTMLACAGRFY
ncbi:hypothetical protein D3C76_1748200 [compost metagenome]